jgi:hypothetical protein
MIEELASGRYFSFLDMAQKKIFGLLENSVPQKPSTTQWMIIIFGVPWGSMASGGAKLLKHAVVKAASPLPAPASAKVSKRMDVFKHVQGYPNKDIYIYTHTHMCVGILLRTFEIF